MSHEENSIAAKLPNRSKSVAWYSRGEGGVALIEVLNNFQASLSFTNWFGKEALSLHFLIFPWVIAGSKSIGVEEKFSV